MKCAPPRPLKRSGNLCALNKYVDSEAPWKLQKENNFEAPGGCIPGASGMYAQNRALPLACHARSFICPAAPAWPASE